MNRYLNSFLITFFLYTGLAYALYIVFEDKKILIPKTQTIKTISLNHIELKKEIVKAKVLESKKVEPKEIVKEIVKQKIVKKKIVKKKVIKKKVVKKKIVKKEIVKKEIVKKVLEKPIEAIENTVKESTKKVAVKESVKKVPLEKSVKKDYLDKHLAQIRKHIMQNAKYSKRAKRLRIQDVIRVKFTLLSSGVVSNIQIIKGNKHLHKSAIKAIQKASAYFPKVSKNIDIVIPIEYKLI